MIQIGALPDDKSPAILVVDDEPLIRMYVADVLAEAGFEAIEANCGADALERLGPDGERFRAVITDIEMPGGLNGCDLAWRIHKFYPAIAIVLTSGLVRPANEAFPPEALFLPKPAQPRQLIAALEDALKANRETRQPQ